METKEHQGVRLTSADSFDNREETQFADAADSFDSYNWDNNNKYLRIRIVSAKSF